MQCPACNRELTSLTVESVRVDVCNGGCAGIWFDHGEMARFDEPTEAAGTALLDIPRDPDARPELSRRLNCPVCTDTVMMRHYFSVKKTALVDECPGCGGYWLDPGELREIRSEYPSEAARDEAASELFNYLFSDDLAEEREMNQQEMKRYRRVANALGFVCPSYYIPGKQDGAAF